MPGPCSHPHGGKTKAVLSPRPAYRGETSHSPSSPPGGLRKALQALNTRKRSYEDTALGAKTGFRKPGSLNLHQG